jgi:hypothetical protein
MRLNDKAQDGFIFIYPNHFKNDMLTGKMTATWLILLTIAGCAAVPVLLIYYTTVHPFVDTHPPKITLGLVDLIPKAITIGLVNPVST